LKCGAITDVRYVVVLAAFIGDFSFVASAFEPSHSGVRCPAWSRLVGEGCVMRTDPIADFLTKIRNAARARHNKVEDNYSRLREAVARLMMEEGFLERVEIYGQGARKKLSVGIRYGPDNLPVIQGIKKVSRPSTRVYVGAREMPKVQSGLGINIVTTPLGVMTDREARKRNVGGELLLAVW
jgi:small subunit ribosomal protein S8